MGNLLYKKSLTQNKLYSIYIKMILKPKICDLHNDLITVKDFNNASKYLIDNSKYLSTLVLAIWTTHTQYNNFDAVKKLINRFKDINIKTKLLFGIEDISFISEKDLEGISALNPFYVSLTWNYNNSLGGGAYGESGLKEKGKQVLYILKRKNIVLDTAHLNEKTFWDCIQYFNGFFINSHTCFYSVLKHKRNINDEQIEAIIKKGGIIGLAFVGEFLCKDNVPKVDDVIRHIDYFINKFGDSRICLGTDYHGTENLPQALNKYSNISILVEKLYKIGYNKKTVEKLFYKNFENFLRYIDGT